MLKYKYIGEGEVHLPQHGKTVKQSEIIEVEIEINHPQFELVKEEKPKKR